MTCEPPILLVEDNQDDIDLTLRAFKKHGMANPVLVAKDGAQALDFLLGDLRIDGHSSDPLPILTLLDLNLPKVNGIEVLRRIRENPRTKMLSVVVLTSSQEEEDVTASYRLHANSYIRKPVDFNQFVGVIGHLGLYWILINHPPPCQQP